MNKLEPNMYVRINNDIRKICIGIGKIKQINQETIYIDMGENLPISFNENQISKASYNIIDLIEKDDLVTLTNKYCKKEIYRVDGKCGEFISLDTLGDGTMIIKESKQIENIVTKEQMEAMAYKVD